MIRIYTDGSCLKNPGGKGGWAACFEDGRQISGGELSTTNNRMELTAVIEALRYVSPQDEVIIYTDSSYVKNGITSWIKNWKRNGWLSASKSPVLNQDLWKILDRFISNKNVKIEWIKGHAGDPLNEDADYLARQRAKDVDQSYRMNGFAPVIKKSFENDLLNRHIKCVPHKHLLGRKRKTKFRGKSFEGWHKGDLHSNESVDAIIDWDRQCRYFEVDPSTVGEFTGAFDINDGEIYEGDICEKTDKTHKLFVGWDAYNLKFAFFRCNGKKSHFEFNTGVKDNFRVIGNVHDNPDFLSKKHEKTPTSLGGEVNRLCEL